MNFFIIIMTSTDENYQKILKNLRKAIENQFSKKLTDDEILEKCLKFSKEHLDDLFSEESIKSELISEKIKRIISNAREYQLYDLDKTDDDLLYGISKQ